MAFQIHIDRKKSNKPVNRQQENVELVMEEILANILVVRGYFK